MNLQPLRDLPDLRFTSKRIQEIVGLKVNTLHYYVQSGIVTPDIDKGEGTGHQRLFSETNLMEVAIIARLMRMGLPKKAIGELFSNIRKAGERQRLDPRRLLDGNHRTNYLLIYAINHKPPRFGHRFVIHGGMKYALKSRSVDDRIQLFDVTSKPDPEYIADFLVWAADLIVINLNTYHREFLFDVLIMFPGDCNDETK